MSDTKCHFCNGEGYIDNNKCPLCSGCGYDCENTEEIVCPYCGEEFIDSWEHSRNMEDQITVDCQYCDKEFKVTCEYSVKYTSKKQD